MSTEPPTPERLAVRRFIADQYREIYGWGPAEDLVMSTEEWAVHERLVLTPPPPITYGVTLNG